MAGVRPPIANRIGSRSRLFATYFSTPSKRAVPCHHRLPRLRSGHLVRALSFGPITDEDRAYIRQALDLAKRGLGKTFPNPAVGCVIVKDGEVIGEGFHPKAGEPHAEVFALRAAGQAAESATAYVTLEPCNHYGLTPPCSRALVAAKVARAFKHPAKGSLLHWNVDDVAVAAHSRLNALFTRKSLCIAFLELYHVLSSQKDKVVVGVGDPNPLVGGGGFKTLADAGIEVAKIGGQEEAECYAINEDFMRKMEAGA